MHLILASVDQSSVWNTRNKTKQEFNDQELCGFPVKTAMRVLLRCLNLKRSVGFLDMVGAWSWRAIRCKFNPRLRFLLPPSLHFGVTSRRGLWLNTVREHDWHRSRTLRFNAISRQTACAHRRQAADSARRRAMPESQVAERSHRGDGRHANLGSGTEFLSRGNDATGSSERF